MTDVACLVKMGDYDYRIRVEAKRGRTHVGSQIKRSTNRFGGR